MKTERARDSLLQVRDLTIRYRGDRNSAPVFDRLSFEISSGEIVGIEGRSGCGKTTLGLAILRLLPDSAEISGSISFAGVELLRAPESEIATTRGSQISIMYQEPAMALNPVMRVGEQVEEVVRAHLRVSAAERRQRAEQILQQVCLRPDRFYRAYPHELSGGECHRVILAQALVCRPRLVIADEPTAGLDGILKAEIAELILQLREELGTAFLLISHDGRLIEQLSDRRIDLLQPNTVAESSDISLPLELSFRASSLPLNEPQGSSSDALLTARQLSKQFRQQGFFIRQRRETQALDCVDLVIPQASVVGLIGASGSGKSTLAKCLALMEAPDAGEILLNGRNLLELEREEVRQVRPQIQYVPQDPGSALNPRFSAVEAVEEPLLLRGWRNQEQRRDHVLSLIEKVGLDCAAAGRSCHEFSGGQKQRLVIARALAAEPRLIIYDESLSSLDQQTQLGLLELFLKLKETTGISQMLIAHDVEMVYAIADSVALMADGRIVEQTSRAREVADPGTRSSQRLIYTALHLERVLAEAQ